MGDECLPQHLCGDVAGLAGGFAKMNAALEAVGKRSFSAASGMHLGFDDQVVRAQRPGDFFRFLGRGGNSTGRVRDSEFVEEFFGLIFVDVHQDSSSGMI